MTAPQLPIDQFLQESKNELIIDVRAPIEFANGHISNAINIPLFENAERAEIGTLYKQNGKDIAVGRGLEIVSPKMVPFVDKVKSLSKNKKVYVYCFRGGMRSGSFGWLMNTAGLDAKILTGGYKAFRNEVIDYFKLPKKIILLGGNTGSGKTGVLKNLPSFGHQIVDLEGIAHHKGSAFGSVNELPQNPQQYFDSELFSALRLLDPEQNVILEDESQTIGINKIDQGLWNQMLQATILKLIIPFDLRVIKCLENYTTQDINELKKCVVKISSKLGPLNTKNALASLDKGDLEETAVITLKYYDKNYNYSYAQKTQKIIEVPSDTIDTNINTQKINQALASL